jgi:hypothetical protein
VASRKSRTIELVHDVMKNDLAAGVLPSKYFGANAACNLLTALKHLALPAHLFTARPNRLRLVHHARQLGLRLGTAFEELPMRPEVIRLLPLPD